MKRSALAFCAVLALATAVSGCGMNPAQLEGGTLQPQAYQPHQPSTEPYAYRPSAYDQAIAQHYQNNQAIVEMYQKQRYDYATKHWGWGQ